MSLPLKTCHVSCSHSPRPLLPTWRGRWKWRALYSKKSSLSHEDAMLLTIERFVVQEPWPKVLGEAPHNEVATKGPRGRRELLRGLLGLIHVLALLRLLPLFPPIRIILQFDQQLLRPNHPPSSTLLPTRSTWC